MRVRDPFICVYVSDYDNNTIFPASQRGWTFDRHHGYQPAEREAMLGFEEGGICRRCQRYSLWHLI